MTTVKADGEVAPYEDMENATLLQKECYDLDEDTMIEITTYEKSIPSFARSSRTLRIVIRLTPNISANSSSLGSFVSTERSICEI